MIRRIEVGLQHLKHRLGRAGVRLREERGDDVLLARRGGGDTPELEVEAEDLQRRRGPEYLLHVGRGGAPRGLDHLEQQRMPCKEVKQRGELVSRRSVRHQALALHELEGQFWILEVKEIVE